MVNLLLNFLFRRNISSETSGKLKNDLPSLFGDRMTVKMFADDVKICLVVGDIDSSSVLVCTF